MTVWVGLEILSHQGDLKNHLLEEQVDLEDLCQEIQMVQRDLHQVFQADLGDLEEPHPGKSWGLEDFCQGFLMVGTSACKTRVASTWVKSVSSTGETERPSKCLGSPSC